MVYVRAIDADTDCRECSGIRFFCLNTGERLARDDIYWRVRLGTPIHSQADNGPLLQHMERQGTRYVRSQPDDSPTDNLLALPRTCR